MKDPIFFDGGYLDFDILENWIKYKVELIDKIINLGVDF